VCNFHPQWHRSVALGIIGIIPVILLAVFAGCSEADYPQAKMSLVWEATVSAGNTRSYSLDTGAADVVVEPHNSVDKRLPEIWIDLSGQQSAGIDWAKVIRDNWTFCWPQNLPDRSGWIVIDENRVSYGYVEQTGSGGTISGSRTARLDSALRKIDRKGQIEWETPGLASVSVFHADNSIICCYGKDPAVLKNIDRSQMFSQEYAIAVLEKYTSSPNVVQILDAATGTLLAEFQCAHNCQPVSVLKDSSLCEGLAVVTEERENGVHTRLFVVCAETGEPVLTVDWPKVLPRTEISQVRVSAKGIVAIGNNGSVSLLTNEPRVLWTQFPKGTKNTDTSVYSLNPFDGNIVAVEAYFGQSCQLTVFDGNGNTLVNHKGLRTVVAVTESGTIIATSRTFRAAIDHLYVFDLTGESVKISRAEVPVGERYSLSVSPSGEYVAISRKMPDNVFIIEMHRLEGVGQD
jgi:hypothetical protein